MIDNSKTRLFFVVDTNEEIFATLEAAEKYKKTRMKTEKGVRLYIAKVRHYYWEKYHKSWNYEDFSDTFEIIKQLN